MPPRNLRPCPEWPCSHYKPCPIHGRKNEDQREARRTRKKKLYLSKRWRIVSRQMLEADPWCGVVDDDHPRGCPAPATDVDHVDGLDLIFDEGRDPYDPAELQTLCHSHHSKKTVVETGTSIHLQQQGRGDYRRGEGESTSRGSTPEARPGSRAVTGGGPRRVVRRRRTIAP
jgi:5-methylcytosine-specific restriction endonuclease McrA